MGSGYSKKKKQARELQQQFNSLQEQMKSTEVSGTSGGGLVTIKMNGEHKVLDIAIKPDCIDPEDIEGLQDLIKAAYEDAHHQLTQNAMPNLGGGLDSFPFSL